MRRASHFGRDRATPAWVLAEIALAAGLGIAAGFGNYVAAALLLVPLLVVLTVVATARTRAGRPLAPVAPIVDFEDRAPAEPEPADLMTRGLWVGVALTLLIVAADAQGFTLGGAPALRYSLLIVPLVAILGAAAAARVSLLDRATPADRFLAVLVTCGLVGAVYGKVFRGTSNPAIIIFLPMTLGLAHLLVRAPATAHAAAHYLRVLIRISVVFLVLGVIARTSVWPLGLPPHVAHERAFFVAIGLSAAVFSRRRGAAVVILALAVVMFLQYPAATWLVVLMAGLSTAFATSRRGRDAAAVVLVAFVVGVLGFGFVQVQGGQSSVGKSYFASVGKGDNTDTRSQLWKAAEVEIRKSPWVGSLFTSTFTVPNVGQVISDRGVGQRIEPHNDYLDMLLLGGLFGLLLFGGFIVSTNVIVIRRVHRLRDLGARAECDLARVLLIGFNATLSIAFFNPELSQLGVSTSLFLIYALMMTLRPASARVAETRPFELVRVAGSRS